MSVIRSASRTVADDIESSIRSEHAPAGARLGTKAELLERYGVAPATLNEALRILRERGVVKVKPGPGGGIFVADQPPLSRLAMEIMQLKAQGMASPNRAVEVIDGLDLIVAHHAARFRTPSDIADLKTLKQRMRELWHTEHSEKINWALHRRIADITPNLMLRSFYQNLVDYVLDEGADPTLGVDDFDPRSDERLRIHLELVDAIIDRDADRIDAVLEAHRAEN